MFICRAVGMNVKRRLYERVAVPTALYGDETWTVAVAEKKLDIMEMRCLKSMCEVTYRQNEKGGGAKEN